MCWVCVRLKMTNNKEEMAYYYAKQVEMALERKVDIVKQAMSHMQLMLREMGKATHEQQQTIMLLQKQVNELKRLK